MKKSTVVLLFLIQVLFSSLAHSQVVWTNKNVKVMVKPGTTISINGSMECNSDQFQTAEIENFGQLTLTQNFTSTSTVNPFDKITNGRVIFLGDGPQEISGNKDLKFTDIEINKPSGQVLLNTNLTVENSLIMTLGNVFLNSHHITLPINATLMNEKESSRIADSLGGYIEAETLNDKKENVLGLDFDKVSLSHGVKITRYHRIDASISSGSIQRIYKITASSNDRIANIHTAYFTPELKDMKAQDLSLYYKYEEDTRWIKDNTSLVNLNQNQLTSTLPHEFPNTTLWVTASAKNCRLPNLGFLYKSIDKCQFDTLSLSPQKIFETYDWSTGSAESQITVRTTGVYILNAIDSKGCEGTDSVAVKFNTLPLADFRASVACKEKNVLFTNLSNSVTSPLTYDWTLGDGTTSTTADLTHTYDSLIKYKVILRVQDEIGCSDTTIKDVDVALSLVPMKAMFLFDSKIYEGDTVKFIQVTQPEPREFNWLFKDNLETAQSYSPEHVYTKAGIYDVKLSASNNGCTDTITKRIEVLKKDKLREDISLDNNFNSQFMNAELYPTVANDKIKLKFSQLQSDFPVSVSIYNMQGISLNEQEMINQLSVTYEVSDWAEGIYLVSILHNKRKIDKKFIVHH